MPAEWTNYAVDYRFRDTTYRIEVVLSDDAGAPPGIELDGRLQAGDALALVDDGKAHAVRVRTARVTRAATAA